jgi:hypothetical protein
MKTHDYYYAEGTKFLRIVELEPEIYDVFYMDNDGTEVANWGELFSGLPRLLAEIARLEQANR